MLIFLAIAVIFQLTPGHARYGKCTDAVGTLPPDAIMSGFTFLRIGPYYQETFKGATNVTAVMGAQIRRKRRNRV